MTTTETKVGGDGSSARATGQRRREPGLRVHPVPRQRKVPWMVLGALIVVGSALAFSVWAAALGDREPMLALARDVAAGEEISRTDLREIGVSTDMRIPALPPSAADSVVGRRALTDLRAGTLVAPEQFSASPRIGPGEAVVGLALDRGEAPVGDLVAGDRVLVVRTPTEFEPRDDEEADIADAAWLATVYAVETLADLDAGIFGGFAVSLLVRDVDAQEVARAVAGGRVRLVLLADSAELPIPRPSTAQPEPAGEPDTTDGGATAGEEPA